MTVVNNSAPRTHPNDKLRYIPKSGMSRDHTRTGSRRSRCLGGVAEVRPCETGCSTMLRCPGVGNCQVLKSRGWGIYYILAKKIQIPGVLPGGGMVTAGIEPCIKCIYIYTHLDFYKSPKTAFQY
jgi:hypothetical protein